MGRPVLIVCLVVVCLLVFVIIRFGLLTAFKGKEEIKVFFSPVNMVAQ